MLEAKLETLRGRSAQILDHENCYKAAVLLPLIEYNHEMCVLFEKRSPSLPYQPNEISFPGGSIEAEDENPQLAAIRETCEELSLSAANIEVIAPLDIMVSPFNVIIYPFVGKIDDFSQIQANLAEVAEVLCVPIHYFSTHKPLTSSMWVNMIPAEDFPFDMIPHGKNYPFRQGALNQLFYVWSEHVIWGMTARILKNFLYLID